MDKVQTLAELKARAHRAGAAARKQIAISKRLLRKVREDRTNLLRRSTCGSAERKVSSMPDYRIYRLTPEQHVGGPPEVVSCETDEQAIQHAKRLRGSEAFSLWQGGRLVIEVARTV
jgi:hypothetical protein